MDVLSLILFAVLAVLHAVGFLLPKKKRHEVSRLLRVAIGGAVTPPPPTPPPTAPTAAAAAVPPRVWRAPPRPWGLPVLGNMINLGLKPNPYECMTDMSRKFGAVYGLRLGSTDALVVNDMASIREVLVTKGDHFDGRPDFLRYNALFGGDRDNSLALCDWSKKQASRRNVARLFMHVRPGTDVFQMLNDSVLAELTTLERIIRDARGAPVAFKPLIQNISCNIFSDYLCSRKFDLNDPKFTKLVRNFDEIFWDINQGYAMDFIGWMRVFRLGTLNTLKRLSVEIRQFIQDEIINGHKDTIDYDSPRDFVDMLLKRMKTEEKGHEQISEITALYELEDFIGGHSAVGNIIMQTITQIARNPEVMAKIQDELDAQVGDRQISLDDRASLPYTESTMYEALRVCSSPIVPHVASCDSTVGGYDVRKGTMIFINNFELNMSPQLWSDPQRFDPARFVRGGKVVKPPHFLPFSTGKRSCMGSKMLTNVTFLTVATLLSKFDISFPEDAANTRMVDEHMRPGCLALPVDSFNMVFRERTTS